MDTVFFLVSKIAWFFLHPLSVMLLGSALAATALLARWRRTGLILTIATAALIYIAAFTSAGAFLVAELENRYPAEPDLDGRPVGAIVVLGGAFDGAVTAARGGYALGEAAERFTEAAMLARAHPWAPIIVSGGRGPLAVTGESDAEVAPRFFARLGIEPDRIRLEGRSRNTHQNAALTAPLLDDVDGAVLLVTSAFHMPRAGAFEAAGLRIVPWPTDFRTTGRIEPVLLSGAPLRELTLFTLAVREHIGLIAYRLTGRI